MKLMRPANKLSMLLLFFLSLFYFDIAARQQAFAQDASVAEDSLVSSQQSDDDTIQAFDSLKSLLEAEHGAPDSQRILVEQSNEIFFSGQGNRIQNDSRDRITFSVNSQGDVKNSDVYILELASGELEKVDRSGNASRGSGWLPGDRLELLEVKEGNSFSRLTYNMTGKSLQSVPPDVLLTRGSGEFGIISNYGSIDKLNLKSGESSSIVTYDQLAESPGVDALEGVIIEMQNFQLTQFANWNRDGSRFIVFSLIGDTPEAGSECIFTVDQLNGESRLVYSGKSDMNSHAGHRAWWLDDGSILLSQDYVKIGESIFTNYISIADKKLEEPDSRPALIKIPRSAQFVPGTELRWAMGLYPKTRTSGDQPGTSTVYLYHIPDEKYFPVGTIKTFRYVESFRFVNGGREVVVPTVIDESRGLGLIDLNPVIDAVERQETQDENVMPLVFADGFENGIDRWEPTDESAWTHQQHGSSMVYGLNKRKSDYQPDVRSPHNIALIKDIELEDFVLTFDVRSTKDTGNHRDCCVFFAHRNPEQFYYCHPGAKPDPASGQIMIVNKEPRSPITENEKTVPWDDGWHRVKVVRDSSTGSIEVYFDDMVTPQMSATDKTFGRGRIGIGSFDDMNDFDNIRLYGRPDRSNSR